MTAAHCRALRLGAKDLAVFTADNAFSRKQKCARKSLKCRRRAALLPKVCLEER
jgi:hypothetical protein